MRKKRIENIILISFPDVDEHGDNNYFVKAW